MLTEVKKNTNLGIALGFVLQLVGQGIMSQGGIVFLLLGCLVVTLALAAFVWGCMNYAQGKGHSPNLGFLGLLSLPGLLILFLLPDRRPSLGRF